MNIDNDGQNTERAKECSRYQAVEINSTTTVMSNNKSGSIRLLETRMLVGGEKPLPLSLSVVSTHQAFRSLIPRK
jgi:hypothetical protein